MTKPPLEAARLIATDVRRSPTGTANAASQRALGSARRRPEVSDEPKGHGQRGDAQPGHRDQAEAAERGGQEQRRPLAARGRALLVERVTRAVLTAEGTEPSTTEAYRVSVHLRSIADGHWAGLGEILTLPELASYGFGADETGNKTQRLRAAALAGWNQAGAGSE
jgi:hypothetical protein